MNKKLTDREILYKVIEKAERNGYNFINYYTELIPCDSGDVLFETEIDSLLECLNLLNGIIFSKEFAKAFWRKNIVCIICGVKCENWQHCCTNNNVVIENWKYHLQQLVLEKQPLKYLERFLDE